MFAPDDVIAGSRRHICAQHRDLCCCGRSRKYRIRSSERHYSRIKGTSIMYDFASLPANSRDGGWRNAALAAAPQGKAGPQRNMRSPTRPAPTGEQHYSLVCSRAGREAASQTGHYKPSYMKSSSSISPTPAQSSCGLPSTAAASASPPWKIGGCRHIPGRRCFLHIIWVAVALWQRVHASEQEAASFGGPPEVETRDYTSPGLSRGSQKSTTTVNTEEADHTNHTNAADDTSSANAGQEPTDDPAETTKVEEAELPTLGAEMRQRDDRRKRRADAKASVTSTEAVGRLPQLRRGRDSSNAALNSFAGPKRTLPVLLLAELEAEDNAADYRAAKPVLVIRPSAGTQRSKTKNRRIQSLLSSHVRSVLITTVSLIVSVLLSSALLKASVQFIGSRLKMSHMEDFVLSKVTRSTRMRMVYLTVAAALTRLTIAHVVMLAVGSICGLAIFGGFLAWFVTQAVTGGLTPK